VAVAGVDAEVVSGLQSTTRHPDPPASGVRTKRDASSFGAT